MKTLRVGIVGVGFAGKYHFECLQCVHGVAVEVVGATSLRPESREKFCAERGITPFESVEAMLPHVDVLDILSPPYAHFEQILLAAAAGKHVICEKPLTGCFGPPGIGEDWHGNTQPKAPMLAYVRGRLEQMREAVDTGGAGFGYAENFVYAPSVQKEREIVQKTRAQILRMTGEESHNGSHSPVYGIWRYQGGGSLIGKGCHPLTALLYLKRVEGLARDGRPIRPATVSARTHEITRLPNYDDRGRIRTDYHDTEDYGLMHVTFDDGTVGDVITCELVLGGIYDYVEVFANNHRTRCRMNPAGLMDVYNPHGPEFRDVYLIEKLSTKEGWSNAAPDENWTMGYYAELIDFLNAFSEGRAPQSGLPLAIDTTTTIYAAYVSAEQGGQEHPVPRIG